MKAKQLTMVAGSLMLAAVSPAMAGLIVDDMLGTVGAPENPNFIALTEGAEVKRTLVQHTLGVSGQSDPNLTTYRIRGTNASGNMVYRAPNGFIFNQDNFSFQMLQNTLVAATPDLSIIKAEYTDNEAFTNSTTLSLNAQSIVTAGSFVFYTATTPDTFEAAYVRVTMLPAAGNNARLHIDRLQMNLDPIPEPASLSILGLAGVLMLARRR